MRTFSIDSRTVERISETGEAARGKEGPWERKT